MKLENIAAILVTMLTLASCSGKTHNRIKDYNYSRITKELELFGKYYSIGDPEDWPSANLAKIDSSIVRCHNAGVLNDQELREIYSQMALIAFKADSARPGAGFGQLANSYRTKSSN
jgi:hypothetical protein